MQNQSELIRNFKMFPNTSLSFVSFIFHLILVQLTGSHIYEGFSSDEPFELFGNPIINEREIDLFEFLPLIVLSENFTFKKRILFTKSHKTLGVLRANGENTSIDASQIIQLHHIGLISGHIVKFNIVQQNLQLKNQDSNSKPVLQNF